MWRNYLTVGLRALAKNRTYAFINLFGLAIGLAACLLILLYVQYERSYDDWLPDAKRTYQLQVYYESKTNGDKFQNQGAPYVTKAALLKDFPQIESATYMGGPPLTLIKDGQATVVDDGRLVDSAFLDTIALPMAQGDSKALSRPGTVVMSESEAVRIFGTKNVVGRTVTLLTAGRKDDYRVTGVFRDIPKKSHLTGKMFARADFPSMFPEDNGYLTSWGWTSGWVYVKLRPGTDVATINGQFDAWEKRNIPDETFNGKKVNAGDERTFALVAAPDVHLGRATGSGMAPANDVQTIATFAVIALLILAMACINFTNLATARASQRAREVALRKVLGATRRQLMAQFLGESVLLATIAMLLALAVVEIALPWFGNFLDADLELHYFGHGGLILPMIGLVLLVGAAGGLYPAFYLSRFQPARVLKANKSASDAEGSGRLRSALVVIQFAVSIGLIICTAVIYAQNVYARSLDPGYKRAGLIQLAGVGSRILEPQADALTRAIAKVPGVESTGRTMIGVITGQTSNTGVVVPGREDPVDLGIYGVDAGFFPTMQIRTIAGRVFDERPADDMTTPVPEDPAAERALVARGGHIVINESGVKRLGFKTAQDAIGKTIRYGVRDEYGGMMNLTIIGVVADVRFRTVRAAIEPTMYLLDKHNVNWLVARFHGDPRTVRAGIEQVWRRYAPDLPFDATLADEIIARAYEKLDARAQMFGMFAILAVVIGCLGLFGLAAFTAERRTKEIGIRKVLGARTIDIARLLVWQFTRPVVIANIIAWPAAWWLMREFLNAFDARISLTPVPFIGASLLALAIAVLTIGAHAIRVARTNPVHALRYE
ncbi:putative ABC transport system permease protein [Sphingomonas kyeonggiensis]|uniref:Putative ABC transport system permease protein n=1 Tax=Sphingomonas kyeonggiensis TaxID=1268553 RepID=A0A7W7K2V3_9SPHN|nr:FtsX-like permease family protein [Sphingomonas kyeonggiensis]MBB4840059.1 putative ABC transport system permease protein [Sphingomonas kyeonggiensis]